MAHTEPLREPLPPFTEDTAREKVQKAEDAWNTRDPEKVALAYTPDSEWRNRDEFFQGREAIKDFLTRKWKKENDYRLRKELWCYKNWEFDDRGYMRRREASINDVPIKEADRKFRWERN